MKKAFFLLCTMLGVPGAGLLPAQVTQPPRITVNAFAKIQARPDLAMVFLTVHTTAPLAADALEQNNRRVQALKERLTALGYKEDQVKFSGVIYAPAGGRTVVYGDQRTTGFDVSVNLIIYIDGPELNDSQQFNSRVSGLLDEMSKLGASPGNMPLYPYSPGMPSVVAFTLKDPSALENKAFQQAWAKARPMAEDIARDMNVKITGVESVNAGQQQNPNDSRLDAFGIDVPYKYLSSSANEVSIRVNLYVQYYYK